MCCFSCRLLFCVCMARHTFSAATVSRTSCTRTMRAPRSTASTAAATLATMRSFTG